MKIFKPVWTEGLFIAQHHFQQLDRYHEALVDERMDSAIPFPWGVVELQIDERALEAGQIKINQFEAVLPVGAVVTCSEDANDVLQRAIGDAFPASAQKLDVFVALPRASETQANVELEPKPGAVARYIREPRNVVDVNSGSGEQTVYTARPNLRILFGSEKPEGYDSIRVATLIRSSSGAVIMKATSIPPVMRIGASSFLMSGIQRLLEAMVGRQRSLAASRRQRTAAQIDFQASDTAKFWLLNTLNRFIPLLTHFLEHPRSHPERLYLSCAQLYAELCTFSVQGDPTQTPKFNFLELGDTFVRLFNDILTMLETIIAERYKEVPLQRREDGMYLGRIQEVDLLGHEFFLAARGSLPETQLRERLPKLAKIASWSQVGSILNSAINGAKLELEYTPPGALPIRPGTVFFKVTKTPEYWTDIQGSRTIAIYQPLEPRAVELSLFAVDPSNL